MTYNDDDFLSNGGGKAISWKDAQPGDGWKGKVLAIRKQQQRDMQGNPKTFDSGDPMFEHVFTLLMDWAKTSPNLAKPEGDDDDGQRRLFVRGSKKADSKSLQAAVTSAVVKAGCKGEPDILGGDLTGKYLGKVDAAIGQANTFAAKFERGTLPTDDFIEDDEEPF